MPFDSVLFDLDGTLWDSTDVVLKSWNKVIEEKGLKVTGDQLREIMGLQLPEVSEKLFPQLHDREATMAMMHRCCEYECDLIREEGGRLFEDIEKTLAKLSSKMQLFIVSNCQSGYTEAFLAYHGLSQYFKDFVCAGSTGMSKGENMKIMATNNGLKNPIYVGDTEGDHEAATYAGIPFVFAAYGFGSVIDYDYAVNAPGELVELLL